MKKLFEVELIYNSGALKSRLCAVRAKNAGKAAIHGIKYIRKVCPNKKTVYDFKSLLVHEVTDIF